jgi:hypothetical protein
MAVRSAACMVAVCGWCATAAGQAAGESPESAAAVEVVESGLVDEITDAVTGGRVLFDNRFRVELADTTGRDSSTSITNRIRLGYETAEYRGFRALIEMENVSTPDLGNYFVPPTGDGTPTRTPVGDPPGTEVNRAFLSFAPRDEDGAAYFDLRGGRQRIVQDDQRFIGNVGWRQFEQTFDAASIESGFGVDGLSLSYAYVWGVQRIFGPDGPNWDSDSHLIRSSYKVRPELEFVSFAYLLDFGNDAPAASADTYGARMKGAFALAGGDDDAMKLRYDVTYAYQVDAGSNPVDYEADFFGAELAVERPGLGSIVAGYQLLGSDGGAAAFQFPLGTNHKFQGFADQFLVTPAFGLQDVYVTAKAELPYGIKAAATYHQFWSDEGGTDLGNEIDVVASKKLTDHVSVLVKLGFFDGHNGQPDTSRVTMQTTIRF